MSRGDRTPHDAADGRVAVVAGGTAGLGLAVARGLATDGWHVAVLARDEARLAAVADELEEASGRPALRLQVDVADDAAVDAAAQTVERELGPIELWVAGPTANAMGEFLDVASDDFERVTEVTYHGTVNGTRAALARMVPRDRGHVVLFGSGIAHHGVPLMSAYSGAKAATRGFGEAVAAELRMRGSRVRVSMLDFPAIDTPLYRWTDRTGLPHAPRPLPAPFTPEACARAVLAVVRWPRLRTWVGEPTVLMALGSRLWPGGLDAFFARFGRRLQQSARHDGDMLPANLWEPTPGDVGTRGVYGREALRWSPQLWAITHRRAAGALAAAGIVWGALRIVDRARRGAGA